MKKLVLLSCLAAVALAACQNGHPPRRKTSLRGAQAKAEQRAASLPDQDGKTDADETGGKAEADVVGLWLAEDEAEELKSSGKLESLREKVAGDDSVYSNLRRIDAGGEVTIPYGEGVAPLELGHMSQNGDIRLSARMAAEASKAAGERVTSVGSHLDGDVLVIAGFGGGEARFVRVSESDAQTYFQALKDLKN